MKTHLRFILLLLAILSLASCKESEKDTALRFPAPRSLTAVWKPRFPLPAPTVRSWRKCFTITRMSLPRKWPSTGRNTTLVLSPCRNVRNVFFALPTAAVPCWWFRMWSLPADVRRWNTTSIPFLRDSRWIWRWYTKRRKADVSQKWWLCIRMQKLPPSVYG